MDTMTMILIATGILVMFAILAMIPFLYRRCGPNQAMIVSGGGTAPAVVVGGGCVVLPVIQRADALSLEVLRTVTILDNAVRTADGINITVGIATTYKVGGTHTMIIAAAERYLDDQEKKMALEMNALVEKHARALFRTMKLEALTAAPDEAALRLEDELSQELRSRGVELSALVIETLEEKR